MLLLYIYLMDTIKIIFSDFDWTLFDHKTRTFNAKGIEGLKKAHDNGVKLIINSARTYYALEKLNTFNLIPFDGCVLVNGGFTMIDGTTLYGDYMTLPPVEKRVNHIPKKIIFDTEKESNEH